MAIYMWREQTVQTFDFANDGQQWWSNMSYNTSYMYWGFTAWQWYYLRAKSSTADEAGFITMPNTLPSWTLKKIKIWYYLPNSSSGVWINASSTSSWYNRWNNSWTIGMWSATAVSIWNYTWELTTEYNLTSTWCTWTCAWVPFSFTTNEANNFITAYNNWTLKLYIVIWHTTSNAYLRKVELTVE